MSDEKADLHSSKAESLRDLKTPEEDAAPSLTPQETKALLRRIDLRLMPIMMAGWTLQFIDKVVLNYANIMGLQKDAHLKGDEFSWLATGFFIAFSIFQLPNTYILARTPVHLFVTCLLVICGISVACTAACNNFSSLMAVRVFLAIGESGLGPSFSLVTMKWYTRAEASKRYGIWYCGLGIGQILGGIMSFGFQHVRRGSFGSWRGMFLATAMINFAVALWTFFLLPDNPTTAKFLSPKERAFLTRRLLVENKYSVTANRFQMSQIVSTIRSDATIWLIFLICVACVLQSGAVTSFSATIIAGFGYNSKQAALLNMPSGAVSIISSLVATWFVESNVPRSLAIIALVVPSVTGASLLSFAKAKAALLLGIWLINVVTPILIVATAWAQANCAGHTKRVFYNTITMIAFGVANICAPQTYRAKDAPNYWPAKVTMVVATACCGLFTLILLGVYILRNRKAHSTPEHDTKDDTNDNEKTDLEIPGFRYVY